MLSLVGPLGSTTVGVLLQKYPQPSCGSNLPSLPTAEKHLPLLKCDHVWGVQCVP